MKVLKKILNWISVILLFGGVGLMVFAYYTNKPFLNYISGLLADAKFGTTLKQMLIGIGMVFAALLLFSLSLRIGGKIRKKEKERQAAEKERQKEEEKKNQELRAQAEAARAEAEKMRQEAEKAQAQLRSMDTASINTEEVQKQ